MILDESIRRASYDQQWPSIYALGESAEVAICLARTAQHRQDVRALRHRVYVEGEGRLASADDMATTFDRFDAAAAYLVAYIGARAVGCMKVIPDGPRGLPCDEYADLTRQRAAGNVCEFGHILVLPELRSNRLGCALMREALIYSRRKHRIDVIVGDFFADPASPGGLRAFYVNLGFEAVCQPYRDTRFQNSPLSVIAAMRIEDSLRLWHDSAGSQRRLLSFFYTDYERFVEPAPRTEKNLSDLARRKAAFNHPAYSKMALLLGCGVQMRGEDSFVETHDGRKLLALFDQYGNQSLGYSHPGLVAALQDKLQSGNVNSTKILYEEELILLAERVAQASGGALKYSYFANGGGESIDNALKLARAATGRPGVVSAKGCFHGKTFAALSASGRSDHLELFKPLLPGFSQVPFNDLEALREAVTEDTAAVLLEPVQAEHGVIVPDPEYLREVRKLCDATGAVLIFDEMQTAFGRTGQLFAFQTYGVVPDIMCLGKAFGGGIVPISAVVAKAFLWDLLAKNPTTFGSSLGGNPLSCRAGLTVLELTSQPEFLAGVRARSAIIAAALGELPARLPALVKSVRGVGMMFGIELHDQGLAGLCLALLYRRNVTSTYSLYNNYVVRVQPPMTMTEPDLHEGLRIFVDVLEEVERYRQAHVREGWAPRVRHEFVVQAAPAKLLEVLRQAPRAIDPFAVDPLRPLNSAAIEFSGTLGGEPLTWREAAIEVGASGHVLRAEPGWLWGCLERRITVTSGATPDWSKVRVDISWDAGTAAYEPFLAVRIAHYCHERLGPLTEALCRSVNASSAGYQAGVKESAAPRLEASLSG